MTDSSAPDMALVTSQAAASVESTALSPTVAASEAASGDGGVNTAALRDEIISVLTTIYDPEIPVNIYDLGLIYGVDVEPSGLAKITMTLTSPNCPEAQSLPIAVMRKAESVAGVDSVEVVISWDPAWDPSKMSDAAKLALNML